jgi:hypothetical protein
MAASMKMAASRHTAQTLKTIVLMMEAVSTSETFVVFYEAARSKNSDGCHIHSLPIQLS